MQDLATKTLKQLKAIACQFGISSAGDRRCRQSWIHALVNVNLPLQELLEVSPAVEVDPVSEPIAPAVKTKKRTQKASTPAVKTKKRTQKLIEVQAQEPPIVKVVNILKLKTPEELSGIAWEFFNQSPEWLKEVLYPRMDDCCEEVGFVEKIIRSFCRNALCGCNFDNIFEKSQALLAVDRNKKRQPLNRKSYPIYKLVRIPKDALGYSGWLRTLTFPQLKKLAAERNVFLDSDSPQDWIEGILRSIDSTPSLVDSEGFALSFLPPTVDEYLKSFTFGDCPPNGGDNGRDRLETEAKVSQSAIAQVAEISPGVEFDRVPEPIIETVETSPAASVEQVQEAIEVQAQEPPIESKFGRIVYPRLTQKSIEPAAETSPGVEVDPVSELIAQVVEISPGVEFDPVSEPIAPAAKKLPGSRSKASTAHQLLELFKSRAHVIEDSPGVKTEATVSESVIGLPAKNPILTGIALSDKFCVRYSPPQPEIHYKVGTDGQLSLLDFEVEPLVDEPPDPDDFESLEAFTEVIARWDSEHPEELAASLDSMCEWAPCPADWYEFDTPREPSEVSELSRVFELAEVLELSTSNFFIPTFSAEGVSPNRTDEPPDTGLCARLPKPKPPSFPPTAVGYAYQTYTKRRSNASQTQSKRIPNSLNLFCQSDRSSSLKLVYCGAIPVGRAPPGGDAM